jgi:hypothetical protein
MTMVDENDKGKQLLWYVRSGEGVNGPYPSGAIRRFLLLGRVSLADEISRDRKVWQSVSAVPEVIPAELRRAMLEGREDEVILARRREDERTGTERRSSSDDKIYAEQRKGERRSAEAGKEQRHREARRSLLQLERKRERPTVSLVVSLLLIVALIVYGVYWDSGPKLPDPDCTALPGPGVNWRNCSLNGLAAAAADMSHANMNNAQLRESRLSGSNLREADLQYADFSGADLSYSQLMGANLKGATLQNSDLSYADLSGANLSFTNLRDANLGGANLEGVRFDEAVWFDGSRCLPGSLGDCVVAQKGAAP